MPQRVLYWSNIAAPEAILNAYEAQFKKLLTGDYKALHLDLKKVPGYRIYSIRAGLKNADRLLFTTQMGKDQREYLLYLDLILNHEYLKSPFLDQKYLKIFFRGG